MWFVLRKLTVETAHVVLQLPARGLEGVANGDINSFMRMVLTGSAVGNHKAAGKRQLDPDAVAGMSMMPVIDCLQYYAAGNHAVRKSLQRLGAALHCGFHCGRMVHAVEEDLHV